MTWQVYDQFKNFFQVDPNSIHLDITIEEHPILLKIAAWDSSSVSLKWQSENSYDGYLVQEYADGATTPTSMQMVGESNSHKDAFLALDTAYMYRIIGQKGDQQSLSNIIRVKSPITILNESHRINEIRVYTISGSLLYQNTFDQHEVKLDVNTFESGFYIIHIIAVDKTEIWRLVKQ